MGPDFPLVEGSQVRNTILSWHTPLSISLYSATLHLVRQASSLTRATEILVPNNSLGLHLTLTIQAGMPSDFAYDTRCSSSVPDCLLRELPNCVKHWQQYRIISLMYLFLYLSYRHPSPSASCSHTQRLSQDLRLPAREPLHLAWPIRCHWGCLRKPCHSSAAACLKMGWTARAWTPSCGLSWKIWGWMLVRIPTCELVLLPTLLLVVIINGLMVALAFRNDLHDCCKRVLCFGVSVQYEQTLCLSGL